MEFEMTAVFHYGKDSEQYIHRFQEKRLDYATRKLYDYSAEQLRALLKLSKDSDTLETAQDIQYNLIEVRLWGGLRFVPFQKEKTI